jgi:hypothetical protein
MIAKFHEMIPRIIEFKTFETSSCIIWSGVGNPVSSKEIILILALRMALVSQTLVLKMPESLIKGSACEKKIRRLIEWCGWISFERFIEENKHCEVLLLNLKEQGHRMGDVEWLTLEQEILVAIPELKSLFPVTDI